VAKPKGYGKRGRPSAKQIKALKYAKSLLDCNTIEEAYMETHKCTKTSANKQAHRMLTPEVLENMKFLIQMDSPINVNKDTLVRLFTMVIARWMDGQEKTADYLRALESLKQLAPEFVDRKAISDLEKMSDDDLNKEIKRLLGGSYYERRNN